MIEAGWLRPNITNVLSGSEAVSWTDGATQRERVFFVRGTRIEMFSLNAGAASGPVQLPASPSALQSGTDVAAVSFLDGATQRIAVAARVASGGVCIWEGTFASGFSSSPWCSAANVASGLDLDGMYANGGLSFFFAGSTYLGRLTRTGALSYTFTNLGVPSGVTTMRPSIAVTASIIDNTKMDVGFVGNSTAYVARVGTTGSAVFVNLGFPAGESPSTSIMAVGVERQSIYNVATMSWVTTARFFLKVSDNELYIASGTASAWGSSWTYAAPPGGAQWWGVGATVEYAGLSVVGTTAAVLGPTGNSAFVVGAWHLGEFTTPTAFRDHLVYQVPPGVEVLGFGEVDPGSGTTGTFAANESTASVFQYAGLATAIRRNGAPPWEVVVSDTFDGGFTWPMDYVVTPVPSMGNVAVDSISDPYTAISAGGGDLFHLSLQAALSGTASSCNDNLRQGNW